MAGVAEVSREVVDVGAVAAAASRLRLAGDAVPSTPSGPGGGAALSPRGGECSVGAQVARFDEVWGDGLLAVRAELGLLASNLHRAAWARQDLERVTARLLSHAPGVGRGEA
ncbi:hypothetical protein GCM10009858_40990 [Terrabacter carboxydivorans]|uniref:Uncharacterized protein n=1 Tax=Terrabacter carboxydivorans TaxID=619730 RepID=A0ABN3MBY7_9MICO